MLTSGFAENNFLLADVVPSMSQLLDNSKPLRTRLSEPVVSPPYSESAHQWLAEVLDQLIDFVHRSEDSSVPELTENDYNWVDAILEELICSVGENESHPLKSLTEFVIRLIHNYEDKYVPELTELFPELAEENSIEEASSENSNPPAYASELSENELAAHSFFSIGCLLWEGGKAENAIAAYDVAIRLRPDYAEVYNNRGNIKNGLGYRDDALDDYDEAIRLNPNFTEAYSNRGTTKSSLGNHAEALTDLNEAIRLQPDFMNAYANRGVAKLGLSNIDEARADFQAALKLAEQQGNNNLKAFVEEWLRQLNIAGEEIASDSNGESVTKQGNKKSRSGGQWKGKVKIAKDFDELSESFIAFFREENE